jgi:sulfate adenylyltransferase subunit 1 (EFTu-like GTPase family)
MDERPLNPSRMYLIKHNARTVAAEVDRGLTLNEIGKAVITTTRPLLFDPYGQNRETGSFILIDSATNFTAGAGMIIGAAREMPRHGARPAAAERIAAAARTARNEADAVEAVRRVLEEVLV